MKVIAMYLPQFHRVKENDEWWGEGFTEWTAVKRARALFDGHNQPRIPLDENYYDLMNKEVMKWQADCMQNYGIDGMCFYHYYFKDGKKILEKPAENLLKWKDINMPFCFSWANESWVRSWSNVNDGNTWMHTNDKKAANDNGILLEQKYGSNSDWEKHFYYLLPFFKDKRYIKKDGHPVFLIYKAGIIHCLKEMLETWNVLAEKEGLLSIYLIGSNIKHEQKEYLDSILIHEPQDTLHRYFINQKEHVFFYDDVWERLLSKPVIYENVCRGSFTGYDDTPRRGENGTVILGSTPQKFQKYFSRILYDSQNRGSEYVFINAWNEWGEGMYLEPDITDRYAYLQSIKNAREHLSEAEENTFEVNIERQAFIDEIKSLERRNLRYKSYWKILNHWLCLKEKNIKLADYLKIHGFLKIAVYGIGMLGKHLVQELSNSDINIAYGIDLGGQLKSMIFPVYTLDADLEDVDAVIVTVCYEFENIKMMLKKKLDCEILSLEEMLEEVNM